ncbi:RICIN domain-containing protein [Catellatospora sp. KI3]|uniref:RICIN domain-containing protein n=1 Tax=Catellatospora sp. KI3 TaxID=3041620 RepID=UPI002482443F|nr:RICIN domain-containing protein [Catellatospora sp. KI3]MDI1465162.1 RICIN domain-containing protein [Catellatospora sp. KI3]
MTSPELEVHLMRRIPKVLLVALVAAAAAALPAAPAHADSWSGVFIESSLSGTCVAVPDAVDGSAATQEICLDVSTQLWNVVEITSGKYRIVSFGTGKCLAGVGTATGSPVRQLTCDGGTAQQWYGSGTGNTLRFTNVVSGKCLSRPSKDPGTALVQGTCVTLYAQWRLLY